MAKTAAQTNVQDGFVEDEHGRILNDPTHAEPLDHGNSTAAWALVMGVLVGMIIACAGLLATSTVTLWIGVGVMAAGLILGFIMRQMGYGINGDKSSSNH